VYKYSTPIISIENYPSRTMAHRSTQRLMEMSASNSLVGEGRPAHKADNLTAICEPII
jgi:hypothetical protein